MEPTTVDRIDHGMSVVASVVANSSGGKKGGGVFSPREIYDSYFDFHRSYEKKKPITDVDQWKSFKKGLISSFVTPKK